MWIIIKEMHDVFELSGTHLLPFEHRLKTILLGGGGGGGEVISPRCELT